MQHASSVKNTRGQMNTRLPKNAFQKRVNQMRFCLKMALVRPVLRIQGLQLGAPNASLTNAVVKIDYLPTVLAKSAQME